MPLQRAGGAPLSVSAPASVRGNRILKPGQLKENPPNVDAVRHVVLCANSDGIDLMRRGRAKAAYEQLKYAEAVLASNPDAAAHEGELLSLTCSNLGCYYRKAGMPRASVRYLGRALRLEEAATGDKTQDVVSLAKTRLNACAALSSMDCHEEAEQMATEATRLLLAPEASEASHEECALLAVACHNLGAEREHLGRWGAAAVAFRQGAEVASRTLGNNSDLTRALSTSCEEALMRAEKYPTSPDRPTLWPPGLPPKKALPRSVKPLFSPGKPAFERKRRAAAADAACALAFGAHQATNSAASTVRVGLDIAAAVAADPSGIQALEQEGNTTGELPALVASSGGGSVSGSGAILESEDLEEWGALSLASPWRSGGRAAATAPRRQLPSEHQPGASTTMSAGSSLVSPRHSLGSEGEQSPLATTGGKLPGSLRAKRNSRREGTGNGASSQHHASFA